jgi:uncharacterized OsmC-like protein
VVKTTKVMGENPRRIAELIVEFTLPHNDYSEKERKIIEGAIKGCPVANSLPAELKISRTILYQA